MAMGNCRPASFAAAASSAQPRHCGRRPGFIDEDKLLRIKIRLALKPRLARIGYVVALLLGGMRRLFGMARPPVGSELWCRCV